MPNDTAGQTVTLEIEAVNPGIRIIMQMEEPDFLVWKEPESGMM